MDLKDPRVNSVTATRIAPIRRNGKIRGAVIRERLPKQRPMKFNARMRAVIQRVSEASVTIAGQIRGAIQNGLVVLLAIEEADTPEDLEWLSGKIVRLRVFPDDNGVMNRSLQEVSGDILLISQFTLFASTKKGNRPSYTRAARPEIAIPLYEAFGRRLTEGLGKAVRTGEFGADMAVSLVNDGPVTIVIDSKNKE